MITLLEFAKRVKVIYEAELAGEHGLCLATAFAARHFRGEGYPPFELYEMEREIDERIRLAAPQFGSRWTIGYYWPTEETSDRIACLDHIIKGVGNESNQSQAQ